MKLRYIFTPHNYLPTAIAYSEEVNCFAYINHNHKSVTVVDVNTHQIVKNISLCSNPAVRNVGILCIKHYLIVFIRGEKGFIIYDMANDYQVFKEIYRGLVIRDVTCDIQGGFILTLSLFNDRAKDFSSSVSSVETYDFSTDCSLSSYDFDDLVVESCFFHNEVIHGIGYMKKIDGTHLTSFEFNADSGVKHSFIARPFHEDINEKLSVSGKKICRYIEAEDAYLYILPLKDEKTGGYDHHCFCRKETLTDTLTIPALVGTTFYKNRLYSLSINDGIFKDTFFIHDVLSGECVYKGKGTPLCFSSTEKGFIIGCERIMTVDL